MSWVEGIRGGIMLEGWRGGVRLWSQWERSGLARWILLRSQPDFVVGITLRVGGCEGCKLRLRLTLVLLHEEKVLLESS